MQRPHTIAFRVSAKEREALQAAAAADRRVLSDWIRIRALDAAMAQALRQPRDRSIFEEDS